MSLPSEGLILPGRLRDLSMGGCCLESPFRLGHGARAEIVVRVNTAIFRAISQVRAIRGPRALGMEFLQLSLGGQEELRELVDRLARLHAHLKRITAARKEEQKELLLREMEVEGLRRYLGKFPLVTVAPFREEPPPLKSAEPERAETQTDDPGDDSSVDVFA